MNAPRDKRPVRGLTLVEVLVCITVIGVLIALLIPAVHAARETARRVTCQGNLRQMGLGLHNYASAVGVLPAGYNGCGLSLHSMILPYIGYRPLYDSINFNVPSDEASNQTAHLTVVEGFACPSDPFVVPRYTSYAGNAGSGPRRLRDGLFVDGLTALYIKMGDIRDGTTQTAAVSEWLVEHPWAPPDRRRLQHQPGDPYEPTPDLGVLRLRCRTRDRVGPGPPGNEKGSGWLTGSLPDTTYNHFMSINEPNCNFHGKPNEISAITAGSEHPDGANVLMADGHVRFVRETIEPSVWRAIGTRSGSETLPEDW